MVCKLQRSLHGLKQGPRQLYIRLDTYVSKIGFERSEYDHCLCYNDDKFCCKVYLLLHVDDMFLVNFSKIVIMRIKNLFKSKFDVKDLGNVTKIMKGNRQENILTVT